MPKYTQQQLEERYQKLPDVLKDAMFSADIATKMFEIGKKFGLNVEKIGFVAEETGYVVLGLTRPTEFVQILADVLKIEESKARAIASDISHQIFFPLREVLKTAHQIEVGEEEIQKGAVNIKKEPPPPLPPKLASAGPLPPPRSIPTALPPSPAPMPEIYQKKEEALIPQPPPTPPKPSSEISTTPVKPPGTTTEILIPDKSSSRNSTTSLGSPSTTDEFSLPDKLPAPKLPAPPFLSKPAEEKFPTPPTLAPKPAAEKPFTSMPMPLSKIPPLDLRSQTKPRPSEFLPKPEAMGKGIFGAPLVISKPLLPPKSAAEKSEASSPPQSTSNSYDPYREPTE